MTPKRNRRGRTIVLWIVFGLALVLLPILIVFLAMSFWPNGYAAHREERAAAARQLLNDTTPPVPTAALDPVAPPEAGAPPPAANQTPADTPITLFTLAGSWPVSNAANQTPADTPITWAELRASHGLPTNALLEPDRILEPGSRAHRVFVTVHSIPEGEEPPTNWADEVDWPTIIDDAIRTLAESHSSIERQLPDRNPEDSPQELQQALREMHLTLDQVESAAFDRALQIPSPLDFHSVGGMSRYYPTPDTALFRTLHYVLLREALYPHRDNLDHMMLVYTRVAVALASSDMGEGPRIAAPYVAHILATPGVADRLTTGTLEAVAHAARQTPTAEQRLAIAEVHHLRFADRMAANLRNYRGDGSTWSYFLNGHPARIVAGMTRPMMTRRLQNLARVSWDGTPEEIEAAIEKAEEAAAWGSYGGNYVNELVETR